MSFNEEMAKEELCRSLLEWINIERKERGSKNRLSNFQQVIDDGCIYEILYGVDQQRFESFAIESRGTKIEVLEKYLEKEMGKRMKLSLKQSFGDFCEEDEIREFAQMVCYLGVHSPSKNDFISRIFKLPEETQQLLMELVQKIELRLENIIELKEILGEFEFLEHENEELHRKLEEADKKNLKLLTLIKESEEENKALKEENDKYRQEKFSVLSALKIDYISEYLLIYNQLKEENERNMDLLKESELKLEASEHNLNQINEKIKSDYLVINDLSEEIDRLKQICNQNQPDNGFNKMLSSVNTINVLRSFDGSHNKENLSVCSTSMKSLLDVPFSSSEWKSISENEEESNIALRIHNQDLMTKLESMYTKYNDLNAETTNLRQRNEILARSSNKYKEIVRTVTKTYADFEFKYKVACEENWRLIREGSKLINEEANF